MINREEAKAYYSKFKELVKPEVEHLDPTEWKDKTLSIAAGAFMFYMEAATQLVSLLESAEREKLKVDLMQFQADVTIDVTSTIKKIIEGAANGKESN